MANVSNETLNPDLKEISVITGKSFRRAVKALCLEEPDMVPIFELGTVPPSMSSHILGRTPLVFNVQLCLDLVSEGKAERVNRGIIRDILELHRKLGLEFMRVPSGYSKTSKVTKVSENSWIINGSKQTITHDGTLWPTDIPTSYDPDEFLKGLKTQKTVNEEILEESLSVLSAVSREVKGEIFVTFMADGSWGPIVSNPHLLINVLRWMYTRSDIIKALITHYTNEAIDVGEAAIDEGADGIVMPVDYGFSGGPWMLPQNFRKFVKPALKRQVEAFKKKGAFAILHSDGNVDPLLPDIIDAGIDAYQGIDYQANMDLERVKDSFGDEICLMGNVSLQVLEHGSEEDLIKDVLRCIRAAAPSGSYALSPSADISLNTNLKNFLLMIETTRKYGKYPL